MTNSFLPDDYKTPSNDNYMKLQPGENKIRILSKPIIGWVYWGIDNKPVRMKGKDRPSVDPNLIKPDQQGNKSIKHFWAMTCWNYKDNAIQILEITQQSVQTSIENYANNAEWGSPFEYNLTITKSGAGKNTEYSVIASPKSPITDDIKKAYTDKGKINLDALFVGGDPFAAAAPVATPTPAPAVAQMVPGADPLPF